MTELNNDSFKIAVEESTPTLVDFWAGWCMPCKIFAPVVEEISHEMDGRANFAKVDIDECPELAAELGIESIPTLILFKDGEELDRIVGMRPRKDVIEMIEGHL